ncbi:MAG: FAD-dependent oxidoreductase, partial [Bdellovibrionales bacterium]|nr:FAD-dependent oxidoreductase [Bdellovibrionales bacterium]
MTERKNIAVIGAGVAGIVAAHVLQRRHNVELFERNAYLGGHTNTVVIEHGPDAGTPVDTGFIVLNDKTYPNFHAFLSQLSVPVRYADMSFSYCCERTGLQYAGTTISGLFAQRKNLLSPRFLGFLADLARFAKRAVRDLQRDEIPPVTLGQYLADGGYSSAMVEEYLLPMGSAIWSSPRDEIREFPAQTFIRFFANHGLLSFKNRPLWQTVVGGSHSYVKRFAETFSGTVTLNAGILGVHRLDQGVELLFEGDRRKRYDAVVLATHADEALSLLLDPTEDEQRLLGQWRYEINHTVLHTDVSALPPNPRAWASWNYIREEGAAPSDPASVTYHMNRLQGLKTQAEYCVTLNRRKPVRVDRVLREFN